MKTNVAPRVVILVLIIVIIIIGAVYMKKASPGARQKEYDDAIDHSVARGAGPVTKDTAPIPPKK
ncbi:MAG: hypothetical protein ACYC0V_05510 [Armatimonadota bacterium]